MIYVMNSAVMPAGNFGRYTYRPATLKDLVIVTHGHRGPWISAIGYPQNCNLIWRWTGIGVPCSRIETVFLPGDRAIVMRLKGRVVNPGSQVSEDPGDWEFAWVDFEALEPL